MEIENAGSV